MIFTPKTCFIQYGGGGSIDLDHDASEVDIRPLPRFRSIEYEQERVPQWLNPTAQNDIIPILGKCFLDMATVQSMPHDSGGTSGGCQVCCGRLLCIVARNIPLHIAQQCSNLPAESFPRKYSCQRRSSGHSAVHMQQQIHRIVWDYIMLRDWCTHVCC